MNLQIMSTSITVQAQKEISGNTAEFAWNYQEGKLPTAINFNLKRGIVGLEGFTGNQMMTGAYYPESGKFDVNNNNFVAGDLDIYQDLLETCQFIIEDLKPNEPEI
ncbi:hypothetical protein [Epilithonimonas xixisoli]|uniref:Uncharacterized protein n=1 Tax=Epilithonimonas xixisoli TaxID=1476462 RepID=A0A4V3H2G3_9FLAO|nr:hypothetical protein [Epilithonimonas xixisoli]TDX83996.1 hypothetical protein B0I22_1584 [Epilithonimonas xixisoli]